MKVRIEIRIEHVFYFQHIQTWYLQKARLKLLEEAANAASGGC